MEDMIINVNTLPKQLNSMLLTDEVSVHKENGVVILTPITSNKHKIESAKKPKRKLGFLKDKVPPLPDSFFDPLPEEELQAWGL